jgi:hypothetical protein
VRGLLGGDDALGDPWLGLLAATGLAIVTVSLSTFALQERLRRL